MNKVVGTGVDEVFNSGEIYALLKNLIDIKKELPFWRKHKNLWKLL